MSFSLQYQMKKMTTQAENERFQREAEKYAAYLETAEGRLRIDLAFANLQELLPQDTSFLRALDLGCGTGAIGVRLARLGMHVTLLDSSLMMLDFAKRAAQEARVTERIALKQVNADEVADLFHAGSFDVIVCHNVLEFVGQPGAVLRGAALALRDSTSVLSVLVRNQAGEVLKGAIKSGDLTAAERDLTAEWGNEALYGGTMRLFRPDPSRLLLNGASLSVVAERGVRVIADYLSPQMLSHEYDRIFELERKLGARPDFAAVARYTQWLARRSGPIMEDRA